MEHLGALPRKVSLADIFQVSLFTPAASEAAGLSGARGKLISQIELQFPPLGEARQRAANIPSPLFELQMGKPSRQSARQNMAKMSYFWLEKLPHSF